MAALHVRRRESADGRWVVLLHGAGMDGTMFDAQVDALPPATAVLCPDLPGHGRSTAAGPFRHGAALEELEALLAPLAGEDVTLVGQSLGGNLVQPLIVRDPTLARRAVLVDCTDNHGPLRRVDVLALRSSGPALRAMPWSWTVAVSAHACGTEPATRAYVRGRLEAIGREAFAQVMDFWREALTPDPTYRFPVPVLAIVGERDRLGNIATAVRRLAERDPHVRLEVVAGAAHNANQDRPARVSALIEEHLGRGCARHRRAPGISAG